MSRAASRRSRVLRAGSVDVRPAWHKVAPKVKSREGEGQPPSGATPPTLPKPPHAASPPATTQKAPNASSGRAQSRPKGAPPGAPGLKHLRTAEQSAAADKGAEPGKKVPPPPKRVPAAPGRPLVDKQRVTSWVKPGSSAVLQSESSDDSGDSEASDYEEGSKCRKRGKTPIHDLTERSPSLARRRESQSDPAPGAPRRAPPAKRQSIVTGRTNSCSSLSAQLAVPGPQRGAVPGPRRPKGPPPGRKVIPGLHDDSATDPHGRRAERRHLLQSQQFREMKQKHCLPQHQQCMQLAQRSAEKWRVMPLSHTSAFCFADRRQDLQASSIATAAELTEPLTGVVWLQSYATWGQKVGTWKPYLVRLSNERMVLFALSEANKTVAADSSASGCSLRYDAQELKLGRGAVAPPPSWLKDAASASHKESPSVSLNLHCVGRLTLEVVPGDEPFLQVELYTDSAAEVEGTIASKVQAAGFLALRGASKAVTDAWCTDLRSRVWCSNW